MRRQHTQQTQQRLKLLATLPLFVLIAVTRCKPEVESRQQLERVLLIEHRDFAGFVRAMRQQFKQLVEAGH